MKGFAMGDEITKLKTEIIKLNTKISKQETEIDLYKLKLQTARSKLAECKAKIEKQKATHEIKILEYKKKAPKDIDISAIWKKSQEALKNLGTGEDKKP
ncbi:MAG: hypothetical protein ACUZ8I_06760 [Candidatus Scalindua sp.]